MGDSTPVTTADQDAWVALCEAARAELAKVVPLIPAMKPDEIKTITGAIQDAMWAHAQALCFDKRVELEHARTQFS